MYNYTEILQSYSQFKLRSFFTNLLSSHLFECNAFMSKSNQQRMYKTKYVIFYNLLHSDICHNTEKKLCRFFHFIAAVKSDREKWF